MRRSSPSVTLVAALVALASSCTGQLPQSFRYKQQEESFTNQQKVNTKIDLLWVIDNSSSMDVSQQALRDKFAGFARKYLKPYWDIRIAVITTDVYLANPAFSTYLNSSVPGMSNYKSNHLGLLAASRIANGASPASDPKLLKLASLGISVNANPSLAGVFASGLKYKDIVPAWGLGRDYARLLPGAHDGPIAGLCFERMPYFLAEDNAAYPLVKGPQCMIRDSSDEAGTSRCLTPPDGSSSVSECVNTTLNDTVRSGQALLSTKLEDPSISETAWVQSLIDQFTVNVSAGTSGSGSERGIGSVLEFLDVNESSPTSFFRKDSLRGIIFLSDEDDQTLQLPALGSLPAGFSPSTDYACDLNSLVAANTGKFANPSNYIQNQYKYCCAEGGGCSLVNRGCKTKNIDGHDYTVGTCADDTKLMKVADAKAKLDAFFDSLDGTTTGASTYFVAAIVPTSWATIEALIPQRYQSDDHIDIMPFYASNGSLVTQTRLRIPAVDRGDRYMELASLVGNGSLSLDLGSPDYSVLLDSIGKTLVEKKSVFPLNFAPTAKSDMIVKVLHADGSATVLREDQYNFEGKSLIVTDTAFVLSLKESDQVTVNYQPKSLN